MDLILAARRCFVLSVFKDLHAASHPCALSRSFEGSLPPHRPAILLFLWPLQPTRGPQRALSSPSTSAAGEPLPAAVLLRGALTAGLPPLPSTPKGWAAGKGSQSLPRDPQPSAVPRCRTRGRSPTGLPRPRSPAVPRCHPAAGPEQPREPSESSGACGLTRAARTSPLPQGGDLVSCSRCPFGQLGGPSGGLCCPAAHQSRTRLLVQPPVLGVGAP